MNYDGRGIGGVPAGTAAGPMTGAGQQMQAANKLNVPRIESVANHLESMVEELERMLAQSHDKLDHLVGHVNEGDYKPPTAYPGAPRAVEAPNSQLHRIEGIAQRMNMLVHGGAATLMRRLLDL